MANEPSIKPPKFRAGGRLKASDFNRIVDLLIPRIIGGRGVNVRRIGKTIIIEERKL
jgi:hypothetical protein